ncbi:diguanylate cyclase [Xylophilus sp. GOD-11R]|uniref:sensor domain-containing diguanylate cyclase n=1 Tax=Xylophilus sp. GOD-11R TaxID=3089814 RepID=UPI00298CE092|nr:diguanylate cyclase [Xylophilus sp. GOD-11R]WPB56037.1 diguanylate cyclase [Xylophilus sp. GOD-11R]
MNLRFSERSLATQMALVFGVLTTLLVLLLSFSFGEMLRGRIRNEAGAALRVVAHAVANQLGAQLRLRSEEAALLARAPGLWERGLDSAPVSQLLSRMQTLSPESRWIGVADLSGVVRNATGGLLDGVSVADRPWFEGGSKGLYIGEVRPSDPAMPAAEPTARPPYFVDFAAPITSGGKITGVLGVHASWEWADRTVGLVVPPDASNSGLQVFVFDRAGQLIYAQDGQAAQLRDNGFRAPAASASEAAVKSAVLPWADGSDYLTSIAAVTGNAPVTALGWQVVVRQPVSLAYSLVRDATTAVLLIGLVASVVASLLAYRAARRLSRHLHGIALAARRVEAGAPGAGMPVFAGSREVTALSSALRNMTVQLLASNSRMEQQVRVRTRELMAANSALDRQARSDPLTGVLNRRGLEERLRLAVASARRGARPLSVAMLDADYFKRINDRFGHEVGDAVLRSLAETLRSRLRQSDAVARLGGEEFIAVLPDTDMEGAMALAEALRAAIEKHEDPVYGSITVSIGVAVGVGADIDGATLLRAADEALYRAKADGRNRVCGANTTERETPAKSS